MLRFFLLRFSWMLFFWTSGVLWEYCMRIAGRHRIHSSHLLFLSPMALLGRGMCSLKSEMNTLVTSLESVIFLFFLSQSFLCSMVPLSSPPSPSLSIRSVSVYVCAWEGLCLVGLCVSLFYSCVVLLSLSYQGCSCSVWCLAHWL